METKPLYLSLGYRIGSILIDLFFLYSICFSIVENHNLLILFYGIFFLFFFILTLAMFIHYTFDKDSIIISNPLVGKKECFIENIVGYNILTTSQHSTLTIYTKDKKYEILISGKKIRKAVSDFIENNCQKILIKNQKELMNGGIQIRINKKRQLHFFSDYLEVIINGNTDRYFYRDLTLKHLGGNLIKLVTDDNRKISFNIYQCRGQFGLFEYLMKYEWKNKPIGASHD